MKIKIGKKEKVEKVFVSKGKPLDIHAKVVKGTPPLNISIIREDGSLFRKLPVYDVAFGVYLPKGKHKIILSNEHEEDAVVEFRIVKPTL